MNQVDKRLGRGVEATVEYLDGDFKVIVPGAFVRCAATGEAIPLEDLRYWNVDRQEAYANPRAKFSRLGLALPDWT